MTDDARFWRGVEQVETDFLADCDEARFRNRMRARGFPAGVIRERLDAVNEERLAISGAVDRALNG